MRWQCQLIISKLSNGLSFIKQFLQTFKIWKLKWDFKNPLIPLWGLICSIVVSTLLHMEINLSVTFLHPGGRSLTTLTRQGPNVSTTPITAMGCRQCLSLSAVQLKDKHCQKPHCRGCRYIWAVSYATSCVKFVTYTAIPYREVQGNTGKSL